MKVSIGKEVAHPNTTEHHIRWIGVYLYPEEYKFACEVGNYEFAAHGESADGPDTGPVYTHHAATETLKIKKPGTSHASSFCSVHGLWERAKAIGVT